MIGVNGQGGLSELVTGTAEHGKRDAEISGGM